MVMEGTEAALTAEGLSKLSHETAESNERAVALFERALGVDAGFAAAYMGLAKAYVQRYDLQLGRSWTEPAVTAGKRAVELDPSLGDAYLALGRAYRMKGVLQFRKDWGSGASGGSRPGDGWRGVQTWLGEPVVSDSGRSALLAGDRRVEDGPELSQLLAAGAIRIGASAADWRAAVRVSGDALVASGATDAAYTDEMIATVEQLGPYIVIAPGIALAHSRPSPAVHHAGISLVTLAQPVKFGHRENDPVRLVVGLAAPDEEGHMTALSTLADFLSDEARREALMGATDPADVRRMVRWFERDQAVDTRPAIAEGKETVERT